MPCCARSESAPVLFVGDVPELHSILLIESRLADFVRMEVPSQMMSVWSTRFSATWCIKHVIRMQVEKRSWAAGSSNKRGADRRRSGRAATALGCAVHGERLQRFRRRSSRRPDTWFAPARCRRSCNAIGFVTADARWGSAGTQNNSG